MDTGSTHTGHPPMVVPEGPADGPHLAMRGWLEPDGRGLPEPAADGAVPGFAASGQVAPLGRVRLVCSSTGRTPGARPSAPSWVTVIAASGESLYGSVRDEGAVLMVQVAGGTGPLDGASGWIRISRADSGVRSVGVEGEIRLGMPGRTSGTPACRKGRLGTCGQSDRGTIAGGAKP